MIVTRIKSTDPVTPLPTNTALDQITAILNTLQRRLDSVDVRGQLTISDLPMADVYDPGTPVYYDAEAQLMTAAMGSFELTDSNEVQPSDSAIVCGVVLTCDDSGVGSVCLSGSVDSGVSVSAVLQENEEFEAGIYFVSASDRGKVTKTAPTYAVPAFIALSDSRIIVGSPYLASLFNAAHFPVTSFVRSLAASSPLSVTSGTGSITISLANPVVTAADLSSAAHPGLAVSGSPTPTASGLKTVPVVGGIKTSGGLLLTGGTSFTANGVALQAGSIDLKVDSSNVLNSLPPADVSIAGCSINSYKNSLSYYSMGGISQLVCVFHIPLPTVGDPVTSKTGFQLTFGVLARVVMTAVPPLTAAVMVIPRSDTAISLPADYETGVSVDVGTAPMSAQQYKMLSVQCPCTVREGDTVVVKLYRNEESPTVSQLGICNIVGGLY